MVTTKACAGKKINKQMNGCIRIKSLVICLLAMDHNQDTESLPIRKLERRKKISPLVLMKDEGW